MIIITPDRQSASTRHVFIISTIMLFAIIIIITHTCFFSNSLLLACRLVTSVAVSSPSCTFFSHALVRSRKRAARCAERSRRGCCARTNPAMRSDSESRSAISSRVWRRNGGKEDGKGKKKRERVRKRKEEKKEKKEKRQSKNKRTKIN